MRKADLLELVNALPDNANIKVADFSLYDTDDITAIVPASDYSNWGNQVTQEVEVKNNTYVIITD